MPPDPADRGTDNHDRDEQSDDNLADDWREWTNLLGYEGRDIRIIFPEVVREDGNAPLSEPAIFGDFYPQPDDPDPEIWPLEDYDPGAGDYDVDDLICIGGTFPAPPCCLGDSRVH